MRLIERLRAEAARNPETAALMLYAAHTLASVRRDVVRLEGDELLPEKLNRLRALAAKIDSEAPERLCGTASP